METIAQQLDDVGTMVFEANRVLTSLMLEFESGSSQWNMARKVERLLEQVSDVLNGKAVES